MSSTRPALIIESDSDDYDSDTDINSINNLSCFDNLSEISETNDIIYNSNDENIELLLDKALSFYNHKLREINSKYENSKDAIVRKEMRNNYKFLGRKDKRLYMYEILKLCGDNITKDEKIAIIKNRKKIIQGIYKHPQAKKTYLSNIEIINSINLNKFIIAITKNTLFANEQWFLRLVSDLKKIYPTEKLSEIIAVLSSEKSDFNGDATHFKTIYKLIFELRKTTCKCKILFICSNTTRYNGIFDILDLNTSLRAEQKKQIELYIDEAHNTEEGIPPNRHYIENMMIYPYIKKIVPITGTYEPLFEITPKMIKKNYIKNENNFFWTKKNLDTNAINYTNICEIKSNSYQYSSLNDAGKVTFEEIKENNEYINYEDNDFSEELYKYCYPDITKPEDIEKKRRIEYHTFMKNENDAFCIGKNLLNNYLKVEYEYDGNSISEKLIKPNEFNIYLFRTPKRVVFTVGLIHHALRQSYKCICIGLYNKKETNSKKETKIHIWYKHNDDKTVTISYEHKINKDKKKKETNEKIFEIIEYLKSIGINTNVPIIIFGNYQNTGESITFVNHKYGTIRAVIILPENYVASSRDNQTLCRENYIGDKFFENDSNFIMPPKFIVGYDADLKFALEIEKSNDIRVDYLKESKVEDIENQNITNDNLIIEENSDDDCEIDGSNISIPVKIEINDESDERVIELRKILKDNKKRNESQRNRILEIIKELYFEKIIDITDPSEQLINSKERKINDKFNLEGIRTFSSASGDNIDNYRIESFHAKHCANRKFMNNPLKYKKFDCQIEVCLTKYEKILKISGSETTFINWPKTIWLGYKY
jgi:hypothetical protein